MYEMHLVFFGILHVVLNSVGFLFYSIWSFTLSDVYDASLVFPTHVMTCLVYSILAVLLVVARP